MTSLILQTVSFFLLGLIPSLWLGTDTSVGIKFRFGIVYRNVLQSVVLASSASESPRYMLKVVFWVNSKSIWTKCLWVGSRLWVPNKDSSCYAEWTFLGIALLRKSSYPTQLIQLMCLHRDFFFLPTELCNSTIINFVTFLWTFR